MYYFGTLIFVAITISFNQLTYYVNENNETVELMATLSNPSTTDITVQIISNDITAMSKFTYVCIVLPHLTKYIHKYIST